MTPVVLLGSFVAPLVAGLVYLDATRRNFSRSVRLRWTVGVALVSVGGFLLPLFVGDALVRAYLLWTKPAPVVTSPLERLGLHAAVGLAVTGVALVGYGIGTVAVRRRGGPSDR
ncbi:hypothetical protein [Haloplanus aerogenes]|uniref:Uncharacterized protein n=1 Tax=Haloplanus aerogenes TaxID=660522 RepID=A0A3M0CYP4_9EURY|nr:hypothetical protein [Haloplanus aerogenes]AZH24998.1 hypothetical protein DU502_06265 [Haloplanus aerogenes]RMB13785.1 hypothetical protein ATH50_2226 [Haloplanus aerogenes]